MQFTTTIVFLISLTLNLSASTTAHPLNHFAHHTQSLQYRDSRILPPKSLTSRLSHFITSRSNRLRRRGLPGAVYICTSPNFRGDCAWTMPSNKCHIPGTGDNSPQSIGPDPSGFCILYANPDCTGNQVQTIRFPGLDSAIPEFQGLQCFADGESQAGNATSIVQNGGYAGAGILKADPRLSGGMGSMERKRLGDVMLKMEAGGFKQGMIGLKKGHYY